MALLLLIHTHVSITLASLEEIMNILGWLLFGLIVGAIAKFLMPGRDPGGWIVTILLGIAGSFVGGFCEVAATLGDKLGAILFQLPPNLKKDLAVFDAFKCGIEGLGMLLPTAIGQACQRRVDRRRHAGQETRRVICGRADGRPHYVQSYGGGPARQAAPGAWRMGGD